MTRVYIDSNVFRYLKNPNYSRLLENLVEQKDKLIFYYSYAHLSDLTRDKTNKKFEDLLFMEQLVDKNYLNLKIDETIVNVQIASPTEAFNNLDHTPLSEILNFTELFSEMESNEIDTPEIIDVKDKMKLMFNMPIGNLGIPNFIDDIGVNNPLIRMLPTLENGSTLMDLIKGMLETIDNLNQDPSIWRGLRNYSIDALNLKKFNIDINNKNFDSELKDTPLQKSFMEFVEETFIHNKSLEKQREFNFFINAYSCLNILGLDNEKNNKVVFSSFQNDAQHAYYAAHCEYLISDDEQLLLKAKVLYNLFGIETKVLNLADFQKNYIEIAGDLELNTETYYKNLVNVIKKEELVEVLDIEEQNKKVIFYKLKNKHFNFFNRLNLVIENNDTPTFIFFNEILNYSKFTSFKEFESITNKIVNILGSDNFGRDKFDEEDKSDIVENKWRGRIWRSNNESFYLEIKPNDFKLCFFYIPNIKI
ncbi:hypothetical protein EKL97_14870 [Flavobacterium sp. LS1P28]|uniref:hypothetical protein n=1 Tax=Flavobacterium sp. LS1P28 TaxID=2497752 RepID=UPI000F817B95|nr:hypothetical protein [Flavobacterium sp. LS1P28]RTY77953.1 hypothetical protein EKL97_14870 [Flavobacterium sp. LS1P28]